jgi:DNA gyrase inhibitor GyrI
MQQCNLQNIWATLWQSSMRSSGAEPLSRTCVSQCVPNVMLRAVRHV